LFCFFFVSGFACHFCFGFTRQIGDLSSVINEKGCVQAGEEWLERNLLVVAGVAVGVAFLQAPILPNTIFSQFYTYLYIRFSYKYV
jgi:hypothetical protein